MQRRAALMSLATAIISLVIAGVLPGTAGAVINITEAEVILIGEEEPVGTPGYDMVSIGDSLVVRVAVLADTAVSHVVADMRKYGGNAAETLYTPGARPAYASNVAWVPTCSWDGMSYGMASMTGPEIHRPETPIVLTEYWIVCSIPDVFGAWQTTGLLTGTLPDTAWTDSPFYAVNSGDDTLFSFTIYDTSGICCNVLCYDCDHFEFETHAYIPPDTVYVDTVVVEDAGTFWIDNTPCTYIGHDDPTVLVTAVNIYGQSDTLHSGPPTNIFGTPLCYDTHHTTWTQLYGSEFTESEDYYFTFTTDNAGVGPLLGLADGVLNPCDYKFMFTSDTAACHVDLRGISHANGNDDIYFLAFDAGPLGQFFADSVWWHVPSPYYLDIDCAGGYNGVPADDIFRYAFPVLPGSTDVAAGEPLPMIWISDSGDTTAFPGFSNRLIAIDNQIPSYRDPAGTDSVTPWDISFVSDTDNAGDPAYLNPVSTGNPTADWVQVRIDLAGLFDLADVADGGWAFADLREIGYNQGGLSAPLAWDYFAGMHPLSPIWGTDSVEVTPSPPSPYAIDQDSITTLVLIIDNAGNSFMVGPTDLVIPVDNMVPLISAAQCSANEWLYTEIRQDIAPYAGYANVGSPTGNLYGNPYADRDKIVLHANLGDAFGADEIADAVLFGNPYCNDPPMFLYDDGTNGEDPVMGDKNYTGAGRIQVGDGADVCYVDTDESEQGFDVLVTDDSGNKGLLSSCINPRVDNEVPRLSPEHVYIYFWDRPATPWIDGDVNGDGVVNVGDSLIFEWRPLDEGTELNEVDSVRVDARSIDPSYTGWIYLQVDVADSVFRNYTSGWPGGPYVIAIGSISGAPLEAAFCAWDNAGNANGFRTFQSSLYLNNMDAPLYLAKTVSLDPQECIGAGDSLTYTLSVANHNYSPEVHDVGLVDSLPDEVIFLSATHGGTYSAIDHAVTWSLGTLGVGEAVDSLRVVALVDTVGVGGGVITNVCKATSAETPSTLAMAEAQVCSVTSHFTVRAGLRGLQGETGVRIPIDGGCAAELKGYSLCLQFDPAVFLAGSPVVDTSGTSASGAFQVVPGSTDSTVQVGVIYSFACPPSIPAGDHPPQPPYVYFLLDVREDAPVGPTTVRLMDVGLAKNRMTDCENSTIVPLVGEGVIEIVREEFIRGDDDGDGEITISDPILNLCCQFADCECTCLDASDTDDDGEVTISDPIYSLAAQFAGGPPPPVPFPGCGDDPTEDGIGCDCHPPCMDCEAPAMETLADVNSWIGEPEPAAPGRWAFPLYLECAEPLLGFECTVGFASEKMKYAGMTRGPGSAAGHDFLLATENAAGRGRIKVGDIVSLDLSRSIEPGVHRIADLYLEISSAVEPGLIQVLEGRFVTAALSSGRISVGTPAGIPEPEGISSKTLTLTVAPNPTQGPVAIEYCTGTTGPVGVIVYNTSGQIVRILAQGNETSGMRRVVWYGDNEAGKQVPPGMYFCRVAAGGMTSMEKIVLIK